MRNCPQIPQHRNRGKSSEAQGRVHESLSPSTAGIASANSLGLRSPKCFERRPARNAVREVRKYSSSHGVEKSSSSNPSASDHMQMKLFRSQRNLYLSGFSLFLWLVLRRTVTLITQLAKELGAKKALENQADSANEAAKNYMEENEKLKWIVNRNGKGDDENQKLAKDVEDLKAELKKTTDALSKARNEVSEVKKRSDSLSREYDRLLKEHTQLQVLWEETDGKKDL